MALSYNNQFKKAGSFKIEATAPIDTRMVVDSVNNLTDGSFGKFAYAGMIVSIKNSGNVYVLTGADSTVANNWKKVGGTGDQLADDLTAITTDEINSLFD